MRRGERRNSSRKPGAGRHDAHVRRHRLDNDRRDGLSFAAEQVPRRFDIVIRETRVLWASDAGMPAESGVESVSAPEPALTRSESTCPW